MARGRRVTLQTGCAYQHEPALGERLRSGFLSWPGLRPRRVFSQRTSCSCDPPFCYGLSEQRRRVSFHRWTSDSCLTRPYAGVRRGLQRGRSFHWRSCSYTPCGERHHWSIETSTCWKKSCAPLSSGGLSGLRHRAFSLICLRRAYSLPLYYGSWLFGVSIPNLVSPVYHGGYELPIPVWPELPVGTEVGAEDGMAGVASPPLTHAWPRAKMGV